VRVFRDLSIRYKLTLLLLGVVSVVLLAVSVANIINVIQFTGTTLSAKYSTLAKIVAAESGAALSIADVDPRGAQQIVSDLAIEPSIRFAALFDIAGKEVVRHPADATSNLRPPEALGAAYTRNGFLDVVQEVKLNDGTVIGRIFLRADTQELRIRILRNIVISIAVFLIALVLALLLSIVLQRFISQPILQLAHVMQQVSAEHNYSLRAEKRGNDELGALCDGFNTMLAEIKRAEDDRRASEERFHAVIENMTEGIVISDLDGQLLHWNRAALDLHGFASSEEWRRRLPEFTEFFELSTLDHKIVSLENWPLSRLLRGERLQNYEVRLRWRDTGKQRIFSYGGDLVLDGGGKQVAFLTMVDVTERRQAEAALRQAHEELERRVIERTSELAAANKELEAFSYSISHDLRAPLRAIDGFSRILLDEYVAALPADAQEYLRDVRSSTQQMGHLVDDLLAFSRLSRQPIKQQPVASEEIISQCLEELHNERDGRRVEIRVGELPACSGDAGLLKQVWVNLLSNALKYTGRRKAAVIEVGSQSGDDSGQTTYFVKDNGVGFDMRYVHKLFGVFQRLHRAEDYAGTGVGLAIVQRIVHRHGGRVWAEALPDQGATFYFTLPSNGAEHG